MNFLLSLFSGGLPWRLVMAGAAAALALAVWFYIGHLQDENRQLVQDLSLAIEAAETNAQALSDSRRHAKRMINALAVERRTFAAREKQLGQIRQEINHAPDSDDGPVAAVLSTVLDSLRSGTARDRPDEGIAPTGSGGVAVVP